VAAAIGRSINIPVLVRTLGQHLNENGYQPNLSFTPDAELLAYLEGDCCGTRPNDPGMEVSDFHLPWWYCPDPEMDQTSFLSFATIHSALEKHRQGIARVNRLPRNIRQSDVSSELNKPAYTWHPDVDRNSDNPCTRCRLYRAVALGAYDKLRDLWNLVHACETANTGERDLAARRASALNLLYEAAVIKGAGEAGMGSILGQAAGTSDTAPVPGVPHATSAGTSRVGHPAAVDGDRMRKGKNREYTADVGLGQSMAEDKWTWGSHLTYDDLTAISRAADRHFQIPHSGYDMELRTGRLRGVASPNPNPAEIEDIGDPELRFDELSADFPFIRDLHPDEIPIAMYYPPLDGAAAADSRYDRTLDDFNETYKAKRRMQDEANRHDSPSSTSSIDEPQMGFPSMRLPPKNYVPPPTSRALAARAVRLMPAPGSFTRGASPSSILGNPQLLGPIYIPSDEQGPSSSVGGDSGPEDAMNIVLSDDNAPNLPAMSEPAQPEDLDAAGSDCDRPMTVVISDSDDDEEIPMTIVMSDSEPECAVEDNSCMGIPDTVDISDSEGSEDSGSGPGGHSNLASGRDPRTGKYTPASFAQFQDLWLE